MARINLTTKDSTKKLILEHLEENASDTLVEKINSSDKTMDGCFSFIREQARKQAKNGVACIRDEEVFGWAVHYFEEDDIKEAEQKIAEENDEDVPDPVVPPKAKVTPIKKKEKKAEPDKLTENQIDIFSILGGET